METIAYIGTAGHIYIPQLRKNFAKNEVFLVADETLRTVLLDTGLFVEAEPGWTPPPELDPNEAIDYLLTLVAQLSTDLEMAEIDLANVIASDSDDDALIAAAEANVANLSTALGVVQTSLTSTQAELDALELADAAQDAAIAAVQTTADDAQADATQALSDAASAAAAAASAQASAATNASDIDAVEANVSALQSSQAAQDATIATNASDIDAVEADVTALESDVTTLQGTVASHATTIADNSSDIDAVEADVAALQTSQAAQDTAISDAQTNINDLSTSMSTVQSTQATDGQRITDVEAVAAANAVDIDALQVDVADHETRVADLEANPGGDTISTDWYPILTSAYSAGTNDDAGWEAFVGSPDPLTMWSSATEMPTHVRVFNGALELRNDNSDGSNVGKLISGNLQSSLVYRLPAAMLAEIAEKELEFIEPRPYVLWGSDYSKNGYLAPRLGAYGGGTIYFDIVNFGLTAYPAVAQTSVDANDTQLKRTSNNHTLASAGFTSDPENIPNVVVPDNQLSYGKGVRGLTNTELDTAFGGHSSEVGVVRLKQRGGRFDIIGLAGFNNTDGHESIELVCAHLFSAYPKIIIHTPSAMQSQHAGLPDQYIDVMTTGGTKTIRASWSIQVDNVELFPGFFSDVYWLRLTLSNLPSEGWTGIEILHNPKPDIVAALMEGTHEEMVVIPAGTTSVPYSCPTGKVPRIKSVMGKGSSPDVYYFGPEYGNDPVYSFTCYYHDTNQSWNVGRGANIGTIVVWFDLVDSTLFD